MEFVSHGQGGGFWSLAFGSYYLPQPFPVGVLFQTVFVIRIIVVTDGIKCGEQVDCGPDDWIKFRK